MTARFLVILFCLIFNQTYAQKFEAIVIDTNLQIKYQDTLEVIGHKLTGHWKYLEKRDGKFLMDTLFTNSGQNKTKIIIVDKGVVFEVQNDKKTKADYYFETIYDFKNEIGFYSSKRKYINSSIIEQTTCPPFTELVYYNQKFGVLFTGIVGQYFEAIRFIYAKKLILENGEEYLRLQ